MPVREGRVRYGYGVFTPNRLRTTDNVGGVLLALRGRRCMQGLNIALKVSSRLLMATAHVASTADAENRADRGLT